MNNISLLLMFLLIACSCNRSPHKAESSNHSDSVHHPVKISFEYDSSLTIGDSDLLAFTQKGFEKDALKNDAYADSLNSYASVSGDTVKLFFSNNHGFDREYETTLFILPDTAWSKNGFYPDYGVYEDYVPTICSIRVNRRTYQPGDYLTLQIHYELDGKRKLPNSVESDSVIMTGKIKLKIRDADFSVQDLYYAKNRKKFYALLAQRPDTMTNLFLRNCDFKSLPKEIGQFVNLHHLDLHGNDFSKTDLKALQQFKKLQTLDVSECHLQEVPAAVLSLHKLESLTLSENDISELPEGLYHLSALRELWIGDNKISALSSSIRNLKNLEILSTYDTRISSYPKEMIQLKKLVELKPNDTMVFIPDTLKRFVLLITPVYRK